MICLDNTTFVDGMIKSAIKETEYVQSPSGLIMPYFYTKKPKKPSHFDFFAGCGGFGLGVVMAGFETVGANEYDCAAAETYMINLSRPPVKIHFVEPQDAEKFEKYLNRPRKKNGIIEEIDVAGSGWISHYPEIEGCRNFWLGDICKLKGADILDALEMKVGELDLVTGGPPCQGFSRAGKQQVGDPRNSLLYEYARMIVELQPKTFVMENVPDILNFYDPDGVPVLDKFCLFLSEGGYGTWENIKKSILTQAGMAGVIKSKTSPKKYKDPGLQPSLFDDPDDDDDSYWDKGGDDE